MATISFNILFLNTFQVGLSGFITKIPAIFGLYFTLFSKSFKSGFHQFLGSKLYVKCSLHEFVASAEECVG